jgi:hypothetical protein
MEYNKRMKDEGITVVSHVAGVKMEPVQVAKVIRSEKGKYLLVIKGFKFRFKKILADNMERWCCTVKRCKYYIKCTESREIFGGNVKHSYGADSEASLNRQIFNNNNNNNNNNNISWIWTTC